MTSTGDPAGNSGQSLPDSAVLLLAAVGAMGSMAIHMFVPALPLAARDLQQPTSVLQLAVTLNLIGLGIGQLACGPLADRIGRRPVLLSGLAVFAAASLAAALAQSAGFLLAARLVQALGGAAGLVAVRAMVADRSRREEAASRLALLTSVVLLSPAISPVAGGLVSSAFGWRGIFILLLAASAIAALASLIMLPESLGPRDSARQEPLLEAWARLLRNRRFLGYTGAIACSSTALYIFLSGSTFLLSEQFHLSPAQAGSCYFLVAGAGVCGTMAVRKLERGPGAFRIGISANVVGGLALLLLALSDVQALWALIGPMMIAGFGVGLAAPSGMAGAMTSEKGLAGTAASLAGALQMFTSGVATSLVARLGEPSSVSIGAAMLLAGLLGLALAPAGRAVLDA